MQRSSEEEEVEQTPWPKLHRLDLGASLQTADLSREIQVPPTRATTSSAEAFP